MTNRSALWIRNCRFVRLAWGGLDRETMGQLKSLTATYRLSLGGGEIQLLNNRWYVTHSGLLKIAQRKKCAGIRTTAVVNLCDPAANRWVFKATVYKAEATRGFVGFGDADPSNVSPSILGAELRVAETRAVNRALRKAYGIGLCSVEELGYLSSPSQPARRERDSAHRFKCETSSNGHPRLRDQLCFLIRQHQLDPALVKRYAADFCGTQELRGASRELVESFISHLAEWAVRDRSGLLCKLNSFAPSQEVVS